MPCPVTGRAFFYGGFSGSTCLCVRASIETSELLKLGISIVRERMSMVDWSLAMRIFGFGLFAVFCSLGILIGAIYGFGRILKRFEKADE